MEICQIKFRNCTIYNKSNENPDAYTYTYVKRRVKSRKKVRAGMTKAEVRKM